MEFFQGVGTVEVACSPTRAYYVDTTCVTSYNGRVSELGPRKTNQVTTFARFHHDTSHQDGVSKSMSWNHIIKKANNF